MPTYSLNTLYIDRTRQEKDQLDNLDRFSFLNQRFCEKLTSRQTECISNLPVVQDHVGTLRCATKDRNTVLSFREKSDVATFFVAMEHSSTKSAPLTKFYLLINDLYVSSLFSGKRTFEKIQFYRKDKQTVTKKGESVKPPRHAGPSTKITPLVRQITTLKLCTLGPARNDLCQKSADQNIKRIEVYADRPAAKTPGEGKIAILSYIQKKGAPKTKNFSELVSTSFTNRCLFTESDLAKIKLSANDHLRTSVSSETDKDFLKTIDQLYKNVSARKNPKESRSELVKKIEDKEKSLEKLNLRLDEVMDVSRRLQNDLLRNTMIGCHAIDPIKKIDIMIGSSTNHRRSFRSESPIQNIGSTPDSLSISFSPEVEIKAKLFEKAISKDFDGSLPIGSLKYISVRKEGSAFKNVPIETAGECNEQGKENLGYFISVCSFISPMEKHFTGSKIRYMVKEYNRFYLQTLRVRVNNFLIYENNNIGARLSAKILESSKNKKSWLVDYRNSRSNLTWQTFKLTTGPHWSALMKRTDCKELPR